MNLVQFSQSAKQNNSVKDREIHAAVRILRREAPKWQTPVVTLIAESSDSPFKVLISCILSLRARVSSTALASRWLFALADSPETIMRLSAKKIEQVIFP